MVSLCVLGPNQCLWFLSVVCDPSLCLSMAPLLVMIPLGVYVPIYFHVQEFRNAKGMVVSVYLFPQHRSINDKKLP